MIRKLIVILCLLIAPMAWGAIGSTAQWDCRTDAADTNGGFYTSGGTDYSQSPTPIATGTVTSVTTTVTATTAIFTAAMVGNGITDGTTWREITGFTSTTIVTVDASPSWSGATIYVGGSLKSPAIACSKATNDNFIHIKTGTYNCSSTGNVADGFLSPAARVYIKGYNATHGDLDGALFSANFPSLKATSNTMTICAPAGHDGTFANLEFDGDKASRSATVGFNPTSGFNVRVINCRAKNCAGIGFGTNGEWVAWFSESTGCAGAGLRISGVAIGCVARGGGDQGFIPGANGTGFIFCISSGNASNGFFEVSSDNCYGCIAYGNTTGGFSISATDGNKVTFANCIAYGNTQYGWATSSAKNQAMLFNCAGGGNGSGNFNSTHVPAGNKINFVSLSANPFVDAANRDFALNSTSGGGAALKGLGIGTIGVATSYPDIGSIQHRDAGGASVFAPSGVFAP